MASVKPSLWKFGGLTPINLGKNVWHEIGEDEVGVRAAALSYYFVLALFPAALLVLTILGFFASPGSSFHQALMNSMGRMMPGSASDLVRQTVEQVSKNAGTGKALIGIVGALWSAAAGIDALMQSLNVAYDVEERRSFLRRKMTAIGLTLGCVALVFIALSLALFGGRAADWVGGHVGLGAAAVMAWKIAQWPVVLACMFLAFSITYYFGPNVEKPEWHWITPGAALGLIAWLAASFALKLYLAHFNSYSKTYGSVGAVIILLLWLYITGYAIMIGGEVNSVIAKTDADRMRHEERVSKIDDDLQRELAA
jgi:membrane protein